MTKDEMAEWLNIILNSKWASTKNKLLAANLLAAINGWKTQQCMRNKR